MNALEIVDIKKSFRIPSTQRKTVREHFFGLFSPRKWERLDVLTGVTFEVKKGETFGIMGRNGSGKSTLLKIVSGVYQPDAGSVVVRGGLTPILELGLGWNPNLTARDNIYLSGTAMGLTIAQIEKQLDEILAFSELDRFVDLELKHFSSGMGARLAYAIAFSAVREVLLLDEIFAVGDASFMARCKQRYRDLHKAGHTIVLVSHDPKTIASFCERAVLIEGGTVMAVGKASDVADAYMRLLQQEPPGRAARPVEAA
jgi:ABC-type polysaccharide/polyol phosphate transport system ATPase subunit